MSPNQATSRADEASPRRAYGMKAPPLTWIVWPVT
jgi:hypothetical protein